MAAARVPLARLVRVELALVGLVALVFGFGPARAEPLKIRIGWSTMPGHMIPVLYSKPEILKHYGKSYVVEPVLFRGSSLQITAMAAREIDMAALSPQALSLAVTNAHLDVKVVADILQDGVDGYHSDTFLVKRNSGIEKPEDLKGKRIGTNAIGSASDTGMRVLLMNKGLLDKRDFTSVEVAFANMPAMLEEGKVDMGIVVQPFSDQLLKTGKYKVLYDVKDSVGPSQLVFLAARADFLKANRAALEDFFEDHVRAARWFMDPKNKDEARAIIGKFIHQPPETLDYLFTKSDYYRDPYMIPNVANIQSMVDASVKAGALPTQITVAPSHVDLSFVEGAKTRIESDKSTP